MRKDTNTCTILKNAAMPTEKQKENMLNKVLIECRKYDMSPALKISRLITIYPWRFAFGLSTLQAVLCTMIWGSRYTNMVLRVFGG